MKNLKKVVALSLAAVMMFGMMVVGAGAATYTDAADIDNTVAVNVMSAIKILKGDNGVFDPNGNLTRAQAATIVARVKLQDAADVLEDGTTNTIFTDVTADHWASGIIAWAYSQGIVSGHGDGTFTPDANVSGYAFAKMLLCALGYDTNEEDYESELWAINVATRARMAGLLNGFEGNLANDLTRDDAALLAFNAITACETVHYDDELVVDSNSLIGYTYKKVLDSDDTTLAASEYGLVFVDPDYDTNTADGGYWYIDANENGIEDAQEAIAGSTVTLEANIVLTGNKKDLEKAELKGFDTFDFDEATVNGETVVIDGTTDGIESICGNGVTVELYTYGKTVYKVVATSEVLAEVTVSYNETTDVYDIDFENVLDALDTINGTPVLTAASTDDEVAYYNYIVKNFADLDKAYVLLTLNNGTIVDFAEPTIVDGTTKKFTTGVSMNLSGTDYYFAKNNGGDAPNIDVDYNAQRVVLNSDGFVMYVEATPGTTAIVTVPNVLFVTEIWTEYEAAGIRGGSDKTYHGFQAVTMDGKVIEGEYDVAWTDAGDPGNETYDVGEESIAVSTDGGDARYAANNSNEDAMTLVVEYTYNAKKDLYTFKAPAGDDETVLTATKNIGALAGVTVTEGEDDIAVGLKLGTNYYADGVKFIYVYDKTSNGVTSTKVEVLDGAQKIVAESDDTVTDLTYDYTAVLSLDADGNYVVSHVFLDTKPVAPATVYADDAIFVVDGFAVNYYTLAADAETTLAAIDVLVNGVETEILVEAAAGDNMGLTVGYNKYSVDEDLGAYVLEELTSVATKTEVDNDYDITSITYVNGVYRLNDLKVANDAVIYDIAETGMTSIAAMRTAVEKNGFTITVAYNATVDAETGVVTVTDMYVLDME